VIEAQIVTVGQELLRGEISNTNAVYIAQELRKRGSTVNLILTLPDSRQTAAEQLKRCMLKKGIVIMTGGLGGTADDVTRTIVSDMLKRELIVDDKGEAHLREWYRRRGRKFEESDRLQAAFPTGGRLLPNSVGLAYGFYVQHENRHIFSLPGVPAEMRAMFQDSVDSILEERGLVRRENEHETLNFINISEYTLDKTVHGIVQKYKGITYGTRASNGLIRILFESQEDPLAECLVMVEKEIPDNFVYRGERNLEEVVGSLFQTRKHTLSVAESCTGGLLAKVLTDIPGSSNYFLGGVVAYNNKIKHQMLNVQDETLTDYGAVSEKTAMEMATGVMMRFSSTIALSITGIAGPGGGTPDKPVGTVYICAAGRDGFLQVERGQYIGDRDTIRRRSVNKALSMVILHLREQQGSVV
jgi:nicotinamide-nucleotide amidase